MYKTSLFLDVMADGAARVRACMAAAARALPNGKHSQPMYIKHTKHFMLRSSRPHG